MRDFTKEVKRSDYKVMRQHGGRVYCQGQFIGSIGFHAGRRYAWSWDGEVVGSSFSTEHGAVVYLIRHAMPEVFA